MVRQMSNDELFPKYHPELRLRIHNEINLKNDIVLLDKFREFLGDSRLIPATQGVCPTCGTKMFRIGKS